MGKTYKDKEKKERFYKPDRVDNKGKKIKSAFMDEFLGDADGYSDINLNFRGMETVFNIMKNEISLKHKKKK